MKNSKTPKAVYAAVAERANGCCEKCGGIGDWRGLQMSHQKHRQMGGTNRAEVHSAENILCLCAFCHEEWHQNKRRGDARTIMGWIR